MHELSLAQNIVAMVSEQAGDQRVTRVALEIGKLSAVMPDAIRFCFELCCQQTVLEGAELEIREIPGRGRCLDCGSELELQEPYGRCQCGSYHVECIAGDRMLVKEMELA